MNSTQSERRKIAVFLLSIGTLVTVGIQFVPLTVESIPGWQPRVRSVPPRIYWYAYSKSAVDTFKSSGRPLLINFRANWDTLTAWHEQFALETAAVRSLLVSKNVATLRAECSIIPSDEYNLILKNYGAGHIPLVVIHPPNSFLKPIVLEAPISESQVIAALKSL